MGKLNEFEQENALKALSLHTGVMWVFEFRVSRDPRYLMWYKYLDFSHKYSIRAGLISNKLWMV